MRYAFTMRRYTALMAMSVALAAHAGVTQFDASRENTFTLAAGGAVAEWRSVRGGAALTPFHGALNGWGAAMRPVPPPPWAVPPPERRGRVSFAGGGASVPSPMMFTDGGLEGEQGGASASLRTPSPAPVSAVFAVVRCEAAASLTTLFDTPVDVRLKPKETVLPAWAFSEEQNENAAEYRVNGVPTADFKPSPAFQLAEVSFDVPQTLGGIFLGGSVPSPAWKRQWRGEVAEIIIFPSAPSPQERNAVHHYLALKYAIPVAYSGDPATPALLRDIGVATGSIFSTAIIVR